MEKWLSPFWVFILGFVASSTLSLILTYLYEHSFLAIPA